MQSTFWAKVPGPDVWKWMGIGLLLGAILFFVVSRTPTRGRKYVVGAFTFLSGSFYVLNFLWPTPINRQPLDIPNGGVEQVSFFLADTIPVVKDFATILTAFLLGLGVFSLLRVHLTRVFRQGKDWGFSIVLLVSMVAMCGFGYAKWLTELNNPATDFSDDNKWGVAHRGFDLLFDGLLQQMDAAMFSIIAFFILSAAYRAFRIRSVEATIMLATALILMLNLMGAMQYLSSNVIDAISGGPKSDANWFLSNFKLSEVANWIQANMQVPSLRAMDFGIALGALAMGLRLWLNLEKSGVG